MAYNSAIRTFDTIFDLRLQRGTPNVKVNVLGYHTPSDNQGGIFYWDELSTLPDNQGVIIQPSVGDPTGRWIRQVDDNIYNVKWFGAKGDYIFGESGTDDTLAIRACINYLDSIRTEQLHPTLLFPASVRYRITDTLVVPPGINVVTKSEVVYDGPTNQGALVIGRAGAINSGVNFEIKLRQRFIPDWDIQENRDNNFGVKFINLFNTTDGQLPMVAFFCNNIIFEGNDDNGTGSGGFAYNNITFGSSIDAIHHVTIQNLGVVGWVNENKYNAGNFQNSSSTASRDHSRYGITIKTSSTVIPNNNHFYKPCFQLGYSTMPNKDINECLSVLILQGNGNTFHEVRAENSGNTIMRVEGDSFDNYITTGLLFIVGGPVLIDNTTSKYNFVETQRLKATTYEDGLIFNSGYLPQKINKYDAFRYYIPGISWTRSSDGNIYPAGGNLDITDDYIGVRNERPVVFVDTTETKRFSIRYDANEGFRGRIGIRTYDADGNIIPPSNVEGERHVFPAAVYSTIVSSYGGIYHFGNDTNAGYPFLAVDDAVHKVAIIFEGGSQPMQLRSIQIYALDGSSAGAFSGLSTQFDEFGVANIQPTEIKSKGTIIYNDLSVTDSPVAWQNVDGGTTWEALPRGGADSYIQNGTTEQIADFNISGGGRLGGGLGVGTAISPTSAKIYSVSTTIPQIRTEYSAGNRMDVLTSSDGSTTFTLAGTNPTFRFSHPMILTSIPTLATPGTTFLTSNGGTISSRTAAQVLTDIGAAPSTGSTNYIQNQTTVDQSANYRISGNGYIAGLLGVGVGTNPINKLAVNNPTAFTLSNYTTYTARIDQEGSRMVLGGDSTGSYIQTFNNLPLVLNDLGNNVGIGTIPTNKLSVDGNANVTGNFTIGSIPALATAGTVFLTHSSGTVNTRTASQVASDIGAVTLTTTQTISGVKTFTANPIIQGAQASVTFNNNSGVQGATLYYNDSTDEFSMTTDAATTTNIILNHTNSVQIKSNNTLTNTIFSTGRMSGANAVNNNEFVTLSQLNSAIPPTPSLDEVTTVGNSTSNGISVISDGGSIPTNGMRFFYQNPQAYITNYASGSPTASISIHNNGSIIFMPTGGVFSVFNGTGLGVNTTSPSTALHVAGAGTFDGFIDIGGGAANISGLGSATFTSLQVSGNTIFAGNGVPAVGKIPTGIDGAGNWNWESPGAAGIEQWAFVDNIDIMTTDTYTLVPAVAGKRILITFQVYEKRSSTGTGQQDFTFSVGTNASTYNNVTPSSSGNVQSATEVGLYTGTTSQQITRSISSEPLVLNITAGTPVLTTATIRWAVRYVLLDV